MQIKTRDISSKEIKLVGGRNPEEGRIEFLDSKGRWSGICGIGFGRFEGEVACRQLGLHFVKWAGRSFKFGTDDLCTSYVF